MGQRNLLKNSVLYITGTFLYFFFQWLTTVLVVRLAGYEQAGIFSLAVSFSNVFFFIAKFGIRNFQISDTKGVYTSSQYLGARLMAAFLAIAAFAISLAAARLSGETAVACVAYMLFKLEEAVTDHQFSVFQRYEQYRAILISYSVKGIVSLGGFVAGLYFSKSLLAAILLMAAMYGAVMLFYDVRLQRRWEKFGCSFSQACTILRSCIPLMIGTLIVPYMNFIVRYEVQNLCGDEQLGYYSSFAAITVIMTTLASAVWTVLLPKISADFQKERYKELGRFILKISAATLAAGFLVVAFGMLLGPWAFTILYGKDILVYQELIFPVLLTSVLLTFSAFLSAVLVPLHRHTSMLVCNVAGALLCTVTVIPLIRYFGLQGANLSYAIGLLLQIAAQSFIIVCTLRSGKRSK